MGEGIGQSSAMASMASSPELPQYGRWHSCGNSDDGSDGFCSDYLHSHPPLCTFSSKHVGLISPFYFDNVYPENQMMIT